jgi:hypothetical protein
MSLRKTTPGICARCGSSYHFTAQHDRGVDMFRAAVHGERMHYRNGREAKNGDMIVQLDWGKIRRVGVLFGAVPGNSDYDDGYLAPLPSAESNVCLIDCLHFDDVAALIAEKGLDKRPESE